MNNKSTSLRFVRGDVLSSKCPSRAVLGHLTSKWGVLVLHALSSGQVLRFSELRRLIEGISEKMLTQTLKTFEEDGLVKRTSYPVVPPYVEYQLTAKGLEASLKIVELVDWIEMNIKDLTN